VIWLGTVKIRRRCCMCWEDNAVSGELSEIVDEAAADFAREEFVHGGDGAAGFVEGHALDAGHGEKESGDADAFGVWFVDLADEMVEGIEVDATDGDAGGVEIEEFAPDFFFGGVEADDDDGVGFHGEGEVYSSQSKVESGKKSRERSEEWRVMGGLGWVMLSLNHPPSQTEGGAPEGSSRRNERVDMGRSELRPYMSGFE